MDTTEAAKTPLCRTNTFEVGKHDPAGVAHEDVLHHAFPVDQDTNLPIDLARDLRQSPGKFLGDQFFRRDASLIKLLQTLFLKCLESDGVT